MNPLITLTAVARSSGKQHKVGLRTNDVKGLRELTKEESKKYPKASTRIDLEDGKFLVVTGPVSKIATEINRLEGG